MSQKQRGILLNNPLGRYFVRQLDLFRESGGEIPQKPPSSQRSAAKLFVSFFALMLVFTMVSRSASSMTIPRVTVETPGSGTLKREVKVSGELKSTAKRTISVPEGVTILRLGVVQGAAVRQGDVLAELSPESVEALAQKLEAERQSLLLGAPKLEDAEAALEKAILERQRVRQDSETAEADAKTTLDRAQEALERVKIDNAEAMETGQSDRLKKAQKEYESAKRAYDDSCADYKDADREASITVDEAKKAYDEVKHSDDEDEVKAARKALWNAEEARETRLDRLDRSRTAARKAMDEAKAELIEAEGPYTDDAAAEKLRTAQEAVQDAEKALNRAKLSNQQKISDAAQAEEDARRALEIAKRSDQAEESQTGVKLRELEQKLAALEALKKEQCKVLAPVSGRVDSVKGEAGELTTAGSFLTLDSDEAGCAFEGKVDRKDAELLALGDEVKITWTEGGGQTQADGIITGLGSPDDDGKCVLTADLPEGEFPTGRTAELAFSKTTEPYDLCVPVSALRSDAKGDFVLVLRESDGVLGKSSVAERISVEITDRDRERAAVSGALIRDDQVITASTKPLEEGGSVALDTP